MQRDEKKAAAQPGDLKDILDEHEYRTNQIMCLVLAVVAVVLFAVLMCYRLGIFTLTFTMNIKLISMGINVVTLSLAVVYIALTNGRNGYCKYIIMIALLILSFNVVIYFQTYEIILLLPLFVSMTYYNKRLTLITSICIILACFISVYVSVWMGNINLSYVDMMGNDKGMVLVTMTDDEIVKKMYTVWFPVVFSILAVISVIAYLFTCRGHKLMEQKAAAVSAQTTIAKELSIASDIQRGMLPGDLPENECFDIKASMIPAKTVGGDYYDYFMNDDKHLSVIIADVSGKGIPASLFMASAKTMMRSCSENGLSPGDVFDSVNRSLCDSNSEKMFVTAWMCTLDLETGRLAYVNAGHNPPRIVRKDGTIEELNNRPNFILGRKRSIKYKEFHTDLLPGESLFLYTDGITEAMDRNGEMFRTERLDSVLNNNTGTSSSDALDNIYDSITEFTNGAEQSDDMTMVMLRYKENLRISNVPGKDFIVNRDNYQSIMDCIRGELTEKGCTKKLITDFEICSSEILSNIDLYAYSGSGTGTVNISVNVSERSARVVFTDSGPEYDPLKHESPDSEKRISEHKIGGFGILIVKKLMDDVRYERKDGKNILTIKKSL